MSAISLKITGALVFVPLDAGVYPHAQTDDYNQNILNITLARTIFNEIKITRD